MKPINFIELQESLKKISKELEDEQRIRELEERASTISTSNIPGLNILFDVSTGIIVENTRNIEYCYADRAYSVIVTFSGNKILLSKPLKELQEQLPSNQFLRTHKSYLVNAYYIKKFIRSNQSYVMLRSGTRVPVSVRNSATLEEQLKQMLLP